MPPSVIALHCAVTIGGIHQEAIPTAAIIHILNNMLLISPHPRDTHHVTNTQYVVTYITTANEIHWMWRHC